MYDIVYIFVINSFHQNYYDCFYKHAAKQITESRVGFRINSCIFYLSKYPQNMNRNVLKNLNPHFF